MANKNSSPKVGFWHAIRDILIASMSKGQFPLAIVALIVIVLIFKMPPESIALLVGQIVKKLENWSLLGYLLAALTSAGWFIHARWQRRVNKNEVDRLSEERNEWQKVALGEKVESSGQLRSNKLRKSRQK